MRTCFLFLFIVHRRAPECCLQCFQSYFC